MVSRRKLYYFSSCKNTHKNDKISPKFFLESISFEDVNPDQVRHTNQKLRNIHNIEIKLTRFQLCLEIEFACKYKKPLYKTHYSLILVEYEDVFDMNLAKLIKNQIATYHSYTDENSYASLKFQKNSGRTSGKLKRQDTESTRLRELSLMNSTYFREIHYDIHFD